ITAAPTIQMILFMKDALTFFRMNKSARASETSECPPRRADRRNPTSCAASRTNSLRSVLELRQHHEPFLGAARQRHLVVRELERVVRDDYHVRAHAQEAADRQDGIWLLAIGTHKKVF